MLWTAELVSTLGTQMQRTAVAWHVYDLTGDPLQLGMLGLVRFFPVLTFGLLGGALADGRDRRRLLIWTQSALLLLSTVIALLTAQGQVSLATLYGLAFASAAVASVAGPARQAIIPSLVPRVEITAAMSLSALVFQIAMVAGPAIAGAMIGRAGLAAVYAVDAATFLATIGAALRLPPGRIDRPSAGGTLPAIAEGLAFLRTSPVLLGVMTVDFVATFFGASTVLMPVFAEEVLVVGPEGLGLLLAAPAVGSLVGGLVLGAAPMIARPGKGVLIAVFAYGAAVAIFGLSTTVWLSLACLAAGGAADAVSMALRGAVRALATPEQLRGRVGTDDQAASP